jgi:hypothetical protein
MMKREKEAVESGFSSGVSDAVMLDDENQSTEKCTTN